MPKQRPPFSNISDGTDDSDHMEYNALKLRQGSRGSAKSSSACVHCKSLKVKCEFSPGETRCQRCQAGKYECIPRNRKKRKPAPTHEDLQEKAHNQDLQIQALLLRLDQMRADNRIRELMARSQPVESHQNQEVKHLNIERYKRNSRDRSTESAVAYYLSPGQDGNSLSPPDIVKHCALYPGDINELFTIFFDRINPYFSILDRELHTPARLIWTYPFLFTVICAVASRYYTSRTDLYHLAMDFARDAAGRALIDGSKSVDVCQAYLLMAVYPVPKKKWAEDRSWLLMGVAIRMAMELELNLPPPSTCSERESLNRTRTWLNCYCVDGSHAIQFGKMPMLRLDDYMARSSRLWYKSPSMMNIPFDIHLCGYVQMIVLVAEWRSYWRANSSLLSTNEAVASVLGIQEKLSQEMALWAVAYREEYKYNSLEICLYRGNTTQMIASYLRLVVLAVGFQHIAKTQEMLGRDSPIVLKSVQAAREVIRVMVERLRPTGYLRYALEANFLYVSFAAAFLINLLRPKFLPLLDETQQKDIIRDVRGLISVLGSKDVALDGRHTPALYSRFLSSLLAKHTSTDAVSRLDPPGDLGDMQTSNDSYHTDERPVAYASHFSWPDVDVGTQPFENGGVWTEAGNCSSGDIDLSLSYFVRTVTQNFPPGIQQEDPVARDPWQSWDFNEGQVQWPSSGTEWWQGRNEMI